LAEPSARGADHRHRRALFLRHRVNATTASEESWSRCPEYDVPNFPFLHHRVPDCTGTWELQRICAYDVYACPRCYTRHLVTERTILAVEAERRLEVMLQSEMKAPPAS
jgi:hypothetical protein